MRRKGTLKELRMFAGMTRHQLAEAIGKSDSTIQNWETGRSQPNASDIVSLEQVLKIRWADVILVQKDLH